MLRCGRFPLLHLEGRITLFRLGGITKHLPTSFAGLLLFSLGTSVFILQRLWWSHTQHSELSSNRKAMMEFQQRELRIVEKAFNPTIRVPDTFTRMASPDEVGKGNVSDEKGEHFSGTVWGYNGSMPDQCKTKAGVFHPETRVEFSMSNYGPFQFLPQYRNPCWQAPDTKELHCLPSFYLAGFPKCGTSDMYQRITQHPSIAYVLKEPHWVSRKRFGEISMDFYAKRYAHSLTHRHTNQTHTIVGDGSASTAWDNSRWLLLPGNERCTEPQVINADFIKRINPAANIIMMFRNPTSRLYSSFLYFKAGSRNATLESFHREVQLNIAIFNDCRKTNSLRYCAYDRMAYTMQLHVGMYSVFVEDWLMRFPREQMLFIRLEDMKDGTAVMSMVFNFLGVGVPDPATMSNILSLDHRNVGKKALKAEPMLSQTRTLLDDFYRPFNQRLAHILQDQRFLWKE